ncbi:MAG: hypothetical protein Q9162_002714 [Coniocarpon cinnabarinum]
MASHSTSTKKTYPKYSQPSKPFYAQFPSENLVIGAGVAIFHVRTARVVLCYHTRDGYYFLPKGRRDANEGTEQGAEREGFEESGYRNRLLPIIVQHRQPRPLAHDDPRVSLSTEPVWTMFMPQTAKSQYILFWYVAETLAPDLEELMNRASAGEDVKVKTAASLSSSGPYAYPPKFPLDASLKDRLSAEPREYKPPRHENTGVDEDERLYSSELVSIDTAIQRLGENEIMADVVRRGWAGKLNNYGSSIVWIEPRRLTVVEIQELLHVVSPSRRTLLKTLNLTKPNRNTDYHLRRSKFIVYQLAMIFCVVSESLGTAALSDYLKQQDYVQSQHPGIGAEYNDDYIGIASYNIFVGIYVAFVFGGAFFFDLMFPERREDRGIRIAWRCCSVAAFLFAFADVIYIVSSKAARVTGVPNPAEIERLVQHQSGSPLEYRKNGRAVASLVFLWLGWPFVFAGTVIMWFSLRHDEDKGPLSTHAQRQREQTRRDVEAAGGTFELPPNTNVDGYHNEKKVEEEDGLDASSDSPVDPTEQAQSHPKVHR